MQVSSAVLYVYILHVSCAAFNSMAACFQLECSIIFYSSSFYLYDMFISSAI